MYRKINVGTRSLEESKRYYMSFILLQQIHLPGTTNIKRAQLRKGVPYSVYLHTFTRKRFMFPGPTRPPKAKSSPTTLLFKVG